MQLKKGTTIANRYVISGVLGTGGMAIVYKAKDIKLDRDVTLKVMRQEFISDDDFINRFNVEAKAAAKLTHQNIVNVYDVGKFGDIYFIVMEYIEGVTLKEIIKKKGTFTNEEVLGVSIQIAQALEMAHKNNIVHRDIKPQNILITTKGDVKVTDFGIARAVNANTVTSGNNTMGSVHYFSPEQARGGYIDQKSDIYSLGITMFEMATGKLPFEDDTVVAIALKHISQPLPNIKDYNSAIDDSVIKIIEKATQKVSALRYETMESMNNDLKRALIKIGQEEDGSQKNEVPVFIQEEKMHTKLLSEDDITEIRTKAMTAFFDDGEMEEIELLAMDQDDEVESVPATKKFMIGGVIAAILLSFIIAVSVFKYISGGTESIPVPNFVGMQLDDARKEAKDYNLVIEESSKEYNDDYPEGEIITQDYVYGKDNILVGGTVTVITSLGTDKETVPDVVSLDVDEAFDELSELGFETDYKYVFDDEVPLSHVVKQMPNAGSLGTKNDVITLYISKGVENSTTTVPNLKGLTESEAKAKIAVSNLAYGRTTRDYSNDYAKDKVSAQSLTVGSVVPSDTKIDIVLSDGKKPEEPVPSSTPTPTPTPTENETKPATSSTIPFTVPKVSNLEDADAISVKFVKIPEDGSSPSIAYEQSMSPSDLPITVNITGSGKERIQMSIKVNDEPYQLEADEIIDFGE